MSVTLHWHWTRRPALSWAVQRRDQQAQITAYHSLTGAAAEILLDSLDRSWYRLLISTSDWSPQLNYNNKEKSESVGSCFGRISWCLPRNRAREWLNTRDLAWIMTLSYSSFSIKDILTGLDASGKPSTTEELCATKRNNTCSGYGDNGAMDENRVHPETLSPHPSVRNLRSDTYAEENTEEETELIEGRVFFTL